MPVAASPRRLINTYLTDIRVGDSCAFVAAHIQAAKTSTQGSGASLGSLFTAIESLRYTHGLPRLSLFPPWRPAAIKSHRSGAKAHTKKPFSLLLTCRGRASLPSTLKFPQAGASEVQNQGRILGERKNRIAKFFLPRDRPALFLLSMRGLRGLGGEELHPHPSRELS